MDIKWCNLKLLHLGMDRNYVDYNKVGTSGTRILTKLHMPNLTDLSLGMPSTNIVRCEIEDSAVK